MNPRMFTAKHAALYLGISTRSMYVLGIPHYRYSFRCLRWALADLDEHKRRQLLPKAKRERPIQYPSVTLKIINDDTLIASIDRAWSIAKAKRRLAAERRKAKTG